MRLSLGKFIVLAMLLTHWTASPYSLLAQNQKIPIIVSILPQKYFLEKIGGELVDTMVLIKPGQSPATYDITPSQMGELSRARIYFRIGVPFESAFMDKISAIAPNAITIDTRKNITLRTMAAHHGHSCSGHDHSHGTDPHIWLNPLLVKVQAKTICDTLSNNYPEHTNSFEKNYADFCDELDELHQKIMNKLQKIKGKSLVVFHPSWGYFADAYGLKQVPIELEGKTPSPKQLANLMKELKGSNVGAVFVQPQFSRQTAETVARSLKCSVVEIDPLAENYPENLMLTAERISRELAK